MREDKGAAGGNEQVERRNVAEDLTTLIAEIAKVPRDQIHAGLTIDDLKMESVAFVELHVAIEDTYGIELDPLRLLELNEFESIIDYVLTVIDGGADA